MTLSEWSRNEPSAYDAAMRQICLDAINKQQRDIERLIFNDGQRLVDVITPGTDVKWSVELEKEKEKGMGVTSCSSNPLQMAAPVAEQLAERLGYVVRDGQVSERSDYLPGVPHELQPAAVSVYDFGVLRAQINETNDKLNALFAHLGISFEKQSTYKVVTASTDKPVMGGVDSGPTAPGTR